MSNRPIKTGVPGIYKRGNSYVVIYRANGRQRWETARTMKEARHLKDARRAAVASGEFSEGSKLTFREYADEWIERHQGNGRGFRETTRGEYKRSLENRIYPAIGHLRLTEITGRDLAQFVHSLTKATYGPESKAISDSTIRNTFNPVRACLSTAYAEGLIRANPARGIKLPHRPQIEGPDEHEVQAFTNEELAAVLMVVRPDHQDLFHLLAATGLRISECVALTWAHVELDGSTPHVKVRRAIVDGHVHPPKSRHGRRDVPIPHSLVERLRGRRKRVDWFGEADLVFATRNGNVIDVRTMRRRVLKPALEEAGVSWAGYHSFRHTYATMQFSRGANAKQVQRALGHHSAAFTMSVYVHLMDGEEITPLEVGSIANALQTQQSVTQRNGMSEFSLETALESPIVVGAGNPL